MDVKRDYFSGKLENLIEEALFLLPTDVTAEANYLDRCFANPL
jgi:hypothetical protein